MKLFLVLVIIGLLVLGGIVSIYIREEYEENKRLEEFFTKEDNSPEFMKNGDWKNLIFNNDMEVLEREYGG